MTAVNARDARIDALRALAVLLFHTQNTWYLGVGGEVAMADRLRLRDTFLGLAEQGLHEHAETTG